MHLSDLAALLTHVLQPPLLPHLPPGWKDIGEGRASPPLESLLKEPLRPRSTPLWQEIVFFFSFLLMNTSLVFLLKCVVYGSSEGLPFLPMAASPSCPHQSLPCLVLQSDNPPCCSPPGCTPLHPSQWPPLIWWCDPALACYQSSPM